jgi:hypothetical protein
MWIEIHMCTEATLGISLYSYLYLKLAKMLCLSYYFYVFSSTKSENKRAAVQKQGGLVGAGGPNNVNNHKNNLKKKCHVLGWHILG